MLTRSRRNTGPTLGIVQLLLVRSGYCCERCADPIHGERGVDWSVGHRRVRGMGGTRWPGINLTSNLVILGGSGTTGCHGEIESRRAEALRDGWLVPLTTDPAKVPLLINRERFVYLDDFGGYSDTPPEVTG